MPGKGLAVSRDSDLDMYRFASPAHPPELSPKTPSAPLPSEDTPYKLTSSDQSVYSSTFYERDAVLDHYNKEMNAKFVGPMAPLDFLDAFLPLQGNETPPDVGRDALKEVYTPNEPKMYPAFVSVF